MKKHLAQLLVLVMVFGFSHVVFAQEEPAPQPEPGLADQLHNDADLAGEMAGEAGSDFLHNAGQAVVYAGKAMINGVEFVILKTAQGTILVAEAMVRGMELAYEGCRFIALKCAEGVVWCCEQAIKAGQILVDVTVKTFEMVVDGVVYVCVRISEGVVFVAKKVYETALETGELVIRGVKFVIRKTADGIVWVAKKTALHLRRATVVAELRMNISGALAVGGVGARTLQYFNKRANDKDPVISRLGKACLTAAEAFNSTYY